MAFKMPFVVKPKLHHGMKEERDNLTLTLAQHESH
jgi:hypothetical protein